MNTLRREGALGWVGGTWDDARCPQCGRWWLAAVGGWRLAVSGGLSLRAVLNKKKLGLLKDSPAAVRCARQGRGAVGGVVLKCGEVWEAAGGCPRVLLEWRGEGGRESRGEGSPPRFRNAAYPQRTAEMYHTDPCSMYICHHIETLAMQLIFLGPYIVPSPENHQATQTGNAEECSLSSNSSSKFNQTWTHRAVSSCHYGCAACLTNSHRVAIGVFKTSVEHASAK